ncbi:hypothetical protein JW930_04085 [Candidatus Woesearchaeota archaeon]|nr:hypothetical protein [Candidatus Woesearchaeota archaeon]
MAVFVIQVAKHRKPDEPNCGSAPNITELASTLQTSEEAVEVILTLVGNVTNITKEDFIVRGTASLGYDVELNRSSYTKLKSEDLCRLDKKVFVNCICPGYMIENNVVYANYLIPC